MAISRASLTDLLRPGLLGPQRETAMMSIDAEDKEDGEAHDEGADAARRKRRRKGGMATGMMAAPRLDRRPRKMAAMPGSEGDAANAVPRGTAGEGGDEFKKGGKLTAAERHALPGKDFALPGERYPINDANHARNALARVSQHGSNEEKAKVRAAVHRKYPGIGEK